MKITTLLLAFFLVTNSLSANTFSKVTANPIMPQLSNLSVCDNNGNGIAVFNLTSQTPIILAAQSGASSNYNVNYYLTLTNANTGSNAIANPSTYTNTANQQVIYVRITLNGTTQNAVGSFSLIVNPLITPTFNSIAPVCQGSTGLILPGASTNNITGSWFPPSVDTSSSGMSIYTFTPDAGQCALPLTMTIFVSPQPTISTPANFATCDADGNNDGYYHYDLSSLIPTILGSQSASNFTVAFYDNQMSAVNNVNVIANLVSYQTYTHSIWISVTNNTSGCYAISSFNTTIEQAPTPVITSNSNLICVDFVTNNVIRNATLTASNNTVYLTQSSPAYTYQWFDVSNSVIIGTGTTFTTNSPFSNNISANFGVTMSSNSALGCSSTSLPFQVLQSGPASPNPTGSIGYSIVNNSGNQTITVEVQGYGTYEYSIDSGTQQTSPIFQNVALGTHSITIWDTKGGISNSCDPIVISNINVNLTATPPPTGSNSQSFNPGTTLASIQVTGQNIKWYSGLNKNVTSTPLPLSTILVDGTTYYASQTIGGYESTTRLPVTVHLALSSPQFELKGLTFAPNPVATNLSIHSDDTIDSYSIYNLLGQLVVSKKCNATSLQIDVTSLNSGNYFVKLTSENKQSTIKIEKK